MATSELVDTSGWDALVRKIKSIGERRVAVGVFGDEELAIIAAAHEFGTEDGHIPERSYIRSTLHEKRSKINDLMKRLAAAYLSHRVDVNQALGLLGTFCANAIKAKIRTNIPPPLALATIKAKGSSKALIRTGRLLNSIAYRIVE